MAYGTVDATLAVEILPEIDRKALADQFEELKKFFKSSSVEVETKSSGTTSKGGSGGGMLSEMLGNVTGMFTKIIGPIAIIAAMANVLKPALKTGFQIVKLLTEFLRPIGEVIMVLLQPILSMIRPMLIVFKSLMAPFRQIAFKGLAAANALIGRGTGLMMSPGATDADKEAGASLITEGWKASLSSASLIFSGFIEILIGPMADLLNLGDSFDKVMVDWQDSALKGIARGTILSEIIGKLGDTAEDAQVGIRMVDGIMTELKNTFATFTLENFNKVMEEGKGWIDGEMAAIKYFEEQTTTALNNLKTTAEVVGIPMHDLKINAALATLQVEGLAKSFSKLLSGEDFKGMYENIKEQAEETRPGFPAKSMEVAKSLSPLHMIVSGDMRDPVSRIKDLNKEWSEGYIKDLEALKGMWSTLPQEQQKGLTSIHENTLKHFKVEGGLIPSEFSKGLGSMQTKALAFSGSLFAAGSIIAGAASRVADGLEKIAKAQRIIDRDKKKNSATSYGG